MVTQEDIAKKLGITRTTVARALNGNKNISSKTKERVLKLSKELGYEKNHIGSSLALKKEKKIFAFLVKSKNKDYSKELKRGLKDSQKKLKIYNYKIQIIETFLSTPKEQVEILKKVLLEDEPSGIIIVPLNVEEIKSILKPYRENLQIVSIENQLEEADYFIEANYHKSGRIAGNIMGNFVSDKEKILVIDGGDDKLTSKKYLNGFLEKINETDKKIIGPVYEEKILDKIEQIISKINDEIKGVYINRYAAEIITKIPDEILKGKKVITNGINKDIKKLIKEGRIIATVFDELYIQGYIAGKILFDKVFKCKFLNEEAYKIKSHIVFKENLDDY
ncbi:MAG: substrate-binding domain-containing protein [Fusobacteriaceae bacterium]